MTHQTRTKRFARSDAHINWTHVVVGEVSRIITTINAVLTGEPRPCREDDLRRKRAVA